MGSVAKNFLVKSLYGIVGGLLFLLSMALTAAAGIQLPADTSPEVRMIFNLVAVGAFTGLAAVLKRWAADLMRQRQ